MPKYYRFRATTPTRKLKKRKDKENEKDARYLIIYLYPVNYRRRYIFWITGTLDHVFDFHKRPNRWTLLKFLWCIPTGQKLSMNSLWVFQNFYVKRRSDSFCKYRNEKKITRINNFKTKKFDRGWLDLTLALHLSPIMLSATYFMAWVSIGDGSVAIVSGWTSLLPTIQ